MATIGNTLKTLYDWAKERDPKGKSAVIAELLSETNEILMDMPYKEGNLPTGDQQSIRTGLPSVYYRLMNQGVPNSKATSAQITENCAMLEGRSQLDKKLATLDGNLASARMNEDNAFLESMNQSQATTMFYGTAANPEEYVGLATRYNDLSANNAQNILSAGGSSSDNTSVFLVGWGMNSAYGIFPKGSTAGLDMEDLGLQDAFDSSNNRFRAYMSHFSWDHGLMVKDWRYVVRIPNIDVSDLIGLTGTQASSASTELVKLMSRAIDRLPKLTGIKPCFYANRTVLSNLRVQALEKSNSAVTIQEALNQFGNTIHETRFLNIPVRLCDAIVNTEAQVS